MDGGRPNDMSGMWSRGNVARSDFDNEQLEHVQIGCQ